MITTVIIFIPLLGAILMLLLPDEERTVRYGAPTSTSPSETTSTWRRSRRMSPGYSR